MTIGLTLAILLSGCASGGGDYGASRYYSHRHRERRMNSNERVYRGSDGRYYCCHSDGTTVLVIGAVTGGVLGSRIALGDSGVLGALPQAPWPDRRLIAA